MIYIRGHARDYDQWRQMGLTGWGYSDVLPYFKRSETLEGGGDAWHGSEGPLHVSKAASSHPDLQGRHRGRRPGGLSPHQGLQRFPAGGLGALPADHPHGERWSARAAYLHPALKRPNLTCLTGRHGRAAS
jgi:choline dehydrogenase